MTQTGKMKLERGEQGIWDTPSWRLIQPNGFPVADIADSLHPEDQEFYAHDILAAVNHAEGYTNEQLEAVSMRLLMENVYNALNYIKDPVAFNASDRLRVRQRLEYIVNKIEDAQG